MGSMGLRPYTVISEQSPFPKPAHPTSAVLPFLKILDPLMDTHMLTLHLGAGTSSPAPHS